MSTLLICRCWPQVKQLNQMLIREYKRFNLVFGVCLILSSVLFSGHLFAQMQKLQIADNNRFLVTEDEHPFVWIGDTNWFFAKLPPATIDSILDTRSKQGFTVMFVSCREKLYNGSGPGSLNNPNEAWWSYLDGYIAKCEQRDLYVGITLGWYGVIKSNSQSELYNYGKRVGARYKDQNNIIWLTLGEAGSHYRQDRLPENKINALVNGIRDGDTGNKLLTIHADYQRGTSISNDGEICDFNNWQTSQWCCPEDLPRKDEQTWKVWEAIQFDYEKMYNGEPKPTLDSEAWYENNKDFCGASPFNIRRRAYFTILAGAFGHTYGAGGIWDGLESEEGCSSNALGAVHYPGAKNMGYLSSFLHRFGKDFLKFRPNQSLVVDGNTESYDTHIQATLASDNSFAVIYSASDARYTVNLAIVSGDTIAGIWYNPRSNDYLTEKSILIEDTKKLHSMDPPGNVGAGNDWILILSDVRRIKNYIIE